ncbi:hypothetical protein [Atopobium fossor]|uniref:hypothetical protein n=1 Tax=Atopobium fossor TaxID=39487 RepID=UPI000413DDE1|nr:hypothetical protein [Atopobium fossor]
MDRLKELKEARTAALNVIARIDNAISSLDSASSWGLFDILGGGTFSSFIKREKIKDANSDIRGLSASLHTLNKELEDVNMYLPNEISDTVTDGMFDIWFDNIFTDVRVQSEIKQSLRELKDFRMSVVEIVARLDAEIRTLA